MRLVELMRYCRVPLALNVQKGEEVLILADTRTEELLYQALAAAAFELEAEPTVMVITARPVDGNEPSAAAAAAMRGVQTVVAATSTSITHTNATRNALAAGVRYVAMPGATIDMVTAGAATADYHALFARTQAVADRLSAAREAHITSPEGTDLRLSLAGRPGFVLAGIFRPGTIAAFPDGEAPIAPVEGSAEGVIVVDSSMHRLGRLREPIRFTVRGGKVVEITGGAEAAALRDLWARQGDEFSGNVGELAIGTNPQARAYGHVSEDKKRLGTVHIGFGDNRTLAGLTESKTHMDGVISRPTVVLDGEPLVVDGRLLSDI